MTVEALISGTFVSGALGAAGLIFALNPSIPAPEAQPVDRFQKADYDVYDRNFPHDGGTCEIGLKDKDICFGRSPLSAKIRKGEKLDDNVPLMSIEFPVIVRTPLKADNLQTVRYGHTVALLDPKTQVFVDVMDLDAPTFAEAVGEKDPAANNTQMASLPADG